MLHCALAEWQLARTRLVRSRLGLWLLLLVGGVALVVRHPVVMAVDVGMLAAGAGGALPPGAATRPAGPPRAPAQPPPPVAVAPGPGVVARAAAGSCGGRAC